MISRTEDEITSDAMTVGVARGQGTGIRPAEKGADQGTGHPKARIVIVIAIVTKSEKTEEIRSAIEIVIIVVAEGTAREVAVQTDTDPQRVVLSRQ